MINGGNNMLENKEIWKDCKGYEGKYQVSNFGRVWSVVKQQYKNQRIGKDGYYKVTLIAKNGKQKTERVHRLVALAFIPNPDRLPQVNHKDECKTNNCVENLEWCDAKYNTLYSSYKWSGENNGMKNPEVRQKHLLICQSDEHREKSRQGTLKRNAECPYNERLTEDGRKALSESRKGHWYTDGINNRFIKDGDIIPEGFVRGMRYTSNKGGELPLCQ